MRIRLLGPLEAGAWGVDITPTAAKPTKLLALLALRHGTTVPMADLVEELWPDGAPHSAAATVQTYVLRLRTRLAEAAARSRRRPAPHPKDVLATRPGGYTLHLARDGLDVDVFERRVEAAYQASAAGDADAAARQFRAALALWRGPLLSHLPLGRPLRTAAAELEERRRTALIRCIDLELGLGRHHEVLAELAAMVDVHATDERVHEQYMLALHRAGRRAQALEVYRVFRRRLVDIQGIEPPSRLRALHHGILASDPVLDRQASARTRLP